MTTLELELEVRLDNLLSAGRIETANLDIFAPIITHREECPICLIPFSIDDELTKFYPCCGKSICSGCVSEHMKTEIKNGADHTKCAFYRKIAKNGNKALRKLIKRDNNPIAFMQMAFRHESGDGILQSNTRALEMYNRAAELGNADAYGYIASYYGQGIAVEQDESKTLEFLEVASKKGSLYAHRLLAKFHGRNDDKEKSIKHMKLVASAGDQDSMDDLMKYYKDKLLSKEDLTQTLRAYQASINETKSKEREDAKVIFRVLGIR